MLKEVVYVLLSLLFIIFAAILIILFLFLFLFCGSIAILSTLLFLIIFLFLKYPVKTNLLIIASLLFFGIPIYYIPILYLQCFAGIALVSLSIAIIFWDSFTGESTSIEKESESSSKEEVTIDIESSTITKNTISSNSIVIEDHDNIFRENAETEYFSQTETVMSYPSLPFSQDRQTIDYKVLKECNSHQTYDFSNDEDDDFCLNQEYTITFPITKIIEPSRLVALEIDIPDLIILKNSQERIFTVFGIDQFGVYIDPGPVFWSATGSKIDSQGKLIVNAEAKGHFKITATSSHAKVSRHNSLKKY